MHPLHTVRAPIAYLMPLEWYPSTADDHINKAKTTLCGTSGVTWGASKPFLGQPQAPTGGSGKAHVYYKHDRYFTQNREHSWYTQDPLEN